MPDQIDQFKETAQRDMQSHIDFFSELQKQNSREATLLKQAKNAIDKKKDFQDYAKFRNLAACLQQQVRTDRQLQLLDQVTPIYEELSKNSDNVQESIASIIKRNNEQILKVFKIILFDFKKQPHEYYR